jgi:hypothetical protein
MVDEIAGVAAAADAGAAAAVAEPEEVVVETEGAGAGGEVGGGEAAPAAGEGAAPGKEGEGAPEPDAELEADGRKVTDANLKKGIAELAKTDRAAAKAVRDAYFSRQAVMREFPEAKGLGEVLTAIREAKATIESLGGQSGISDLQTEVADYRREIDQFAAGDSALLEQLYEANPESMALATSNGLTLLEAKDQKAFDMVILPSIVKRLEQAGLNKNLIALANFIREGKGQEAYDIVTEIGKWLGETNELAKKHAAERATKDPREEKYAAREKAVEEKEQQSYERGVGSEVNRLNNTALSRQVEPFFKELKLASEGRHEFVNGLQSRIWKTMKADATFQRLAKAIMSKGDVAKASAFISAKFAELLPSSFIQFRNALYPNYGKGTTKPAPGARDNGAGGKPPEKKAAAVLGAGGRPKNDDVDWTKTSDTQWIAGKGITLKNGKVINVDWKAVQA